MNDRLPKRAIKTKRDKLRILKGALALLGEHGEHWTKRRYFGQRVRAPKETGMAVASRDTSMVFADSYCLVGALKVSANNLGYQDYGVASRVSIRDLVKSETSFQEVEEWNDASTRRFPEVKEVLERRIAQLEEE